MKTASSSPNFFKCVQITIHAPNLKFYTKNIKILGSRSLWRLYSILKENDFEEPVKGFSADNSKVYCVRIHGLFNKNKNRIDFHVLILLFDDN